MSESGRPDQGPLVGIGAAMCALGIWLWTIAEPYGYRVLWLALPPICAGLIAIGGSIVSGNKPSKGLLFWFGVSLLLLAALAILLVPLVYG